MTFLIGRRGLLVLALVLGAGFAVPPGAVAQALPDYDAKAGMLNIGQTRSVRIPRSFTWPTPSKVPTRPRAR